MPGISECSVAQTSLCENCDVDSAVARPDPPIVQQLLHQHTHADELPPLTIVKKFLSGSSADSAERHRRYAEIGSDQVLRDTLDNVGVFPHQGQVPLPGSALKVGEKKLGVLLETTDRQLEEEIVYLRKVPHQRVKAVLMQDTEGRRLNA